MLELQRRRLFRRALAALLLTGAAALALSGTAHAVSVTLTASASMRSPNPTLVSANANFFQSHPTKVSKTIAADVTYAHSSAWGSAEVKSTGVVKSASGYAYLNTGAPAAATDSRSIAWTATASGTQLVVVGPAGPVDLQFLIPSKAVLLPDDGFDPLDAGTPHPIIDRPVQEIYSDKLPGFPNASPLDLTFTLNGAFTTAGNPVVTFTSNLFLRPNAPVGDQLEGSIANAFVQEPDPTDDANRVRFIVPNDRLLATFTVQANEPFDFDLTTAMSLGAPEFDLPPVADVDPRGAFGAGGSLTFLLLIPQEMQEFYHMQSVEVVPEPSTLALVAAGGLGLAFAAWRRRRLR